MKVLHALLARARGQALAYDCPEQLHQVLEEQRDRLHAQRLPAHVRGAAQLSDSLSFQPGLIALAGEAQDSALYLEALLTVARESGHTELAEALQEAAAALQEAAAALEPAVRATISTPHTPVSASA